MRVYTNYIPILIDGAPAIVMFASDLYEDLVNVECVAETLMLSLQPPSVCGSKLDAPESDGLVADCDATFSEYVFDVAVAKRESEV